VKSGRYSTYQNGQVIGEIKLFKASNQLLLKMIHCFEWFKTTHTSEWPCWSEQ